MKEIIEKLQSWKSGIEYDVNQDWNDDKLNNLRQLMYLEQAINLLSSVGSNESNIPE